eukprot:11179233-Lingulodinium_polyedra.AAC.1
MDRVRADDQNDFSRAAFDDRQGQGFECVCWEQLIRTLKKLVAGAKNGFGLFRGVVREEDPATASTEYSLRFSA